MTIDKILVLLGGLALIAGILWYFFLARRPAATAAVGTGGAQEILITVRGGYSPSNITVKAGAPIRLVFDRQETNPCSEEVVLADFQVRRFLPPNQRTVVELPAANPGVHEFMCGMGMLHGKLIVV